MASRKKIGITGAGGRIGGILALALAGTYDLRLFVYDAPITNKDTPCQTLPVSSLEVLKNLKEDDSVEIVRDLDLADGAAVKGKFEGLDVVIHLAANGIFLFYYFLFI